MATIVLCDPQVQPVHTITHRRLRVQPPQGGPSRTQLVLQGAGGHLGPLGLRLTQRPPTGRPLSTQIGNRLSLPRQVVEQALFLSLTDAPISDGLDNVHA